jgi:glycyl-tRNA synthetase
MAKDATKMEKIVALCKRRGFIFQSSEIYGGINGFWDYGPLGVELKRNIKEAWWQDMVKNPPTGPDGKEISMVGVDCSIIMNPKVWVASGHATGFQDPMISCKTEGCKGLFRADQIGEMQCPLKPSKAPGQHDKCQLTEARQFNLMFESFAGAIQDEANKVWLRPETAQGIFANFKNVCDSTRVKIPFGIAQIGKAFRNEINPRNYTFRSREFEQMEIEFFCHDKDAMQWWEWWREVRINWYKSLGLKSENLKPRNQEGKELAHYSKACTDIEYFFPFADEPQELEGVAHRGCFDLTQHQQHSGKDLSYFDDEAKERFLPTVIEPSAGADRSTLAFICEAYTVDENRPSPELMRFHPRLAPIKAAVFPLVNKDGLPEIAEPIFREIKKHFTCQFDAKASIGKRYARMDEAGTPFCFTIDGTTKEDGTVTVRDRDTGAQERIDKGKCLDYLRDHLGTT